MNVMGLMMGARRSCDACGAPVEWVDRCGLAYRHRDRWREAIEVFGHDAVMAGRAWECTSPACPSSA